MKFNFHREQSLSMSLKVVFVIGVVDDEKSNLF